MPNKAPKQDDDWAPVIWGGLAGLFIGIVGTLTVQSTIERGRHPELGPGKRLTEGDDGEWLVEID